MITPEELGRRLQQARTRAGYTQGEVAGVVGLDATAIAKIERGRRGVGAIELKDLASLYGISPNALLENGMSGGAIELRVALRVGEATDHRAGELVLRLQHIIADDCWLRDRVVDAAPIVVWKPITQPSQLPASSYARGYAAAEEFRQRFSLGESPIRDVALLADEVGVVVARLPLGATEAPDGCSAIDPAGGSAYVLINSDKPRVRRRFTIAHELGHLALEHLKAGDMALDGNVGEMSRPEAEANAFAAGLLMPKAGVSGAVERLKARLGRNAGALERVVWLAESFGVSEEAAAYRLVNLGFEGDTPAVQAGKSASAENQSKGSGLIETVRALKIQPGALRRIRMQLGLTPVMADTERGVTEVGPAMRARLAKALEVGLITVDRAARMLHVSEHETYRWIAESGIQLDRQA